MSYSCFITDVSSRRKSPCKRERRPSATCWQRWVSLFDFSAAFLFFGEENAKQSSNSHLNFRRPIIFLFMTESSFFKFDLKFLLPIMSFGHVFIISTLYSFYKLSQSYLLLNYTTIFLNLQTIG